MNKGIKEWVKGHPIEAFFLLGIAICFGTLFPGIYLLPHDAGLFGVLGFCLGKLAVYSPIISGIVVTQVIQPGKRQAPFTRRLRVSLPVWIIAVVVNIASLSLTAPPSVPFIGLLVLSLPVALLPAWVFSSAYAGTDGVKDMLATLIRPKGKVVYYLVALLRQGGVALLREDCKQSLVQSSRFLFYGFSW